MSQNGSGNHPAHTAPAGGRAVRALLRREGLAALAAGLAGFVLLSGDWLLLLVAFLLPDLAMAGYAFGSRAGARIYNLAHTHAAPALLTGSLQAQAADMRQATRGDGCLAPPDPDRAGRRGRSAGTAVPGSRSASMTGAYAACPSDVSVAKRAGLAVIETSQFVSQGV